MKQRKKKQITPKRVVSRIKKSPLFNCYRWEDVLNAGKFDILCLTEGYYLSGLNDGKWSSVTDMFRLLKSNGLRYHVISYLVFRGGKYFYVPNQFISALSFFSGVPASVAASLGVPSALSFAARHPDRWVVPEYYKQFIEEGKTSESVVK